MKLADVQPRGRLVLCRDISREAMAEQTRGGLWLPPSAEDRQAFRQWEIVRCGPNVRSDLLLPGLRVILKAWTGHPIEIEGENCVFASEENIIAAL